MWIWLCVECVKCKWGVVCVNGLEFWGGEYGCGDDESLYFE